ncbi:probable ATP-dependent RNA helicase DDX10 [Acyrthosiphon pisum]|uniref:ATP-dependent RNA helicase n=1 Tax=Acyrthosiphon pisum TaxID=7029 RepID=A0A8R1W5T4_ACYPI|nr:probable ATP-dependent RNA helicase DDX10 [Acyrthosiphon pisum]|eukprot:XP_001948824.1 PREDICTED: probable ATP-dependent RNA helicase DDX10 [Acyrthosiphon pisum]
MVYKKRKIKVFRSKKKKESIDVVIGKLKESYEQIDPNAIEKFEHFPLSAPTLKGLKDNKYFVPTEIQRESIGYSLRGEDILGAAKTGSGKTLAFLIPVLEILYCNKWNRTEGLAALIITPTRELAYQIFETLRKIGIHHDFSAGLIIGGKDLKFERKRLDQCNIMICTPGRLLQHMDENPLFDCSNMLVLVLDEADRCLDMGFQQTMNSIIENLPPERQTLLFSATQTKSVKDLVRLSLSNPHLISVHEDSEHSTPSGLVQSYMVCDLHDKMSLLWSFIKNHLHHKVLVFMSSCKQVKYFYEILCKLRPGTSLLALYGTMHQTKRMAVYESFSRKQRSVLFATDIAARGLDFPAVNWVVQLDCPENANEYIHRAGRTARFQKSGESLLVLLPSELAILKQLENKKIPISEIKVNPNKLTSIQRTLEATLAKDHILKESAQRAFVSYIKSVFLMKDKSVFDVSALDTDSFASSLGLAIPPRVRFLQKWKKAKEAKKKEKDTIAQTVVEDLNEKLNKSSDSEISDDEPEPQAYQSSVKDSYNFHDDDNSDEENDDLFTVKRKDHNIIETDDFEDEVELATDTLNKKKKKPLTKAAVAKKMIKKQIKPNQKTVFDETGEAVLDKAKTKVSQMAREYENNSEKGGIDIEQAKQMLREEDVYDKQLFREKVKAQHREEKRKAKEEAKRAEMEDASSSDEASVDLSWLPDPDKVYGKQDSGDSEDDFDSNCGSESEVEDDSSNIHRPPKRKLLTNKTNIKKRRKIEEDLDEPVDTGLSLMEDEELVLKMLDV